MQVTETNTEGLKREYKVQISAGDIDEKMTGRLQELGSRVNIPGFRPGKVPMHVLRQRFGKSVMGEVLERAVNDSSNQAMSERGLRPATQPKIEITSFDEGKDLEYTLAVEVLPEIEPMDFSTLTLERLSVELEDSAVEETLADLAKAHKTTKPLDQPRKAESGDVLVVDFEGTVDGEAFPGMQAEGHHLDLGSGSFIAGFEDQLIGADVGETREVKVTFPDDYGNDRLAGKEAIFTVKVQNILASVPAEINDDLAKALGEADLATMKEHVRERLGSEYREIARNRLKRELLDRLAEAHQFSVPEGMVEVEFEAIWKQVEEDRKRGVVDAEDEAKDDEALKQEYRDIAERRVRLGLLISEVGQRNGIEVTQEEVNRAMMREAQRHPGHEREVFEFFQKTPEALANLRAPIFEDKVVDFVVELAKVSERKVSTEKFRAEMAAEAEQSEGDAKASEDGKTDTKDAAGTKAKAKAKTKTKGKKAAAKPRAKKTATKDED
ncbi:MAG: trigger factor [Kiloniellaceae bacterium]